MKYIRAKANFFRYRNDTLVVAAAHIIKCMEASKQFKDAKPPLAEVKAAQEAYHRAVLDAMHGGLIYTAVRRETKRKLADLLQQWAQYVNSVADGNLPLLLSSGFPVLTKKRKGEAPKTPASAFLAAGKVSGEIAFGFTPVGRDMLYEYCFATKTGVRHDPLWGEMETKSNSFKSYKQGFTSGTVVYFKVRARNKHGHSEWTAPVKIMVR